LLEKRRWSCDEAERDRIKLVGEQKEIKEENCMEDSARAPHEEAACKRG